MLSISFLGCRIIKSTVRRLIAYPNYPNYPISDNLTIMKNERSSQLILFSLIALISILHAVKLKDQRETTGSAIGNRLMVNLPAASANTFQINAVR